MFSGTFYISLYNQKRYLIADTRKPLREKAMVRKTDSFICSSRRKVIPGWDTGAAVQGWKKGTRCRSQWGGAQDRARGRRTPGSLGELPDPLRHKSCPPSSAGSALRAHPGAPAFASVCWMTGCPARGQELGWGLWKLQRTRNPLSASACRGHGEVGAPSDVRADPA